MKARRPATWTLRTRLLVGLVGLMAGISLVVGVVSVVALNGFLMGQVDQQLVAAAANRPDRGPDAGSSTTPTPSATSSPTTPSTTTQSPFPRTGGRPGAGFTSLFLETRDGVVVNGFIGDAARTTQDLTDAERSALLALSPGPDPRTVSVGTLGDYRVLVSTYTTTSGVDVVTVIGQPLDPISSTVLKLAGVIVGVSLVGLLLAALLGQILVRSALTPLRRVAATATRVSELELERGEVALAERVPEDDTDPRTEVGQVGAALNRMIGHVGNALQSRQESETRVRQFVADASHELRTPLASIRGYSELTRRSRQDSPPDVSHALDRIDSAATRMTSLVEDLLLLARLDSGRPVAAETVDLTQLAVGALSDAHAAGRDHDWQLELPDEPVTLTGDGERLYQAVGNVLANARTHTPPGTRVTLTLAETAETVTVDITDDGPGIPEALQPKVFERFARGDSSRSRAAGSSGLGLAIVAAIVEAHHGTVVLTSEPGRTSVRMSLPRGPLPTTTPAPASPTKVPLAKD